jgi:Tfp pilus assembly protein PilF
VFHLKGRDASPQAAGQQLGVQAVLTGHVTQRGHDLLVSAELVDVGDNRHLWGERYHRPLADALLVQEEISRQIVERLRIRLTGEEQQQATKRYTESGSAYHLYLRGRYFWNQRSPDSLKKAIDYFEQALHEDPNYALAHASLAETYVVMADHALEPPKEALLKIEFEAQKALAIDPTVAEAHAALAIIKHKFLWDQPAAEEGLRRALELKPSYATAHQWYGLFLTCVGRADEGLREIGKAQELDPLSLTICQNVGAMHYFGRRYDQALRQFRDILAIDPSFGPARLWLGRTHVCLTQYQTAIEEFAKLPDDPSSKVALGHAYAVAGDRARAQSILKELKESAKYQYVSAVGIAAIHAGLGEKGEALDWLEKGRDDRSAGMVYLKLDTRFDNLRQEPRFLALLRHIGLPP